MSALDSPYGVGIMPYIPHASFESPETAIARTDTQSALELLKERCEKEHYAKLAAIGESIVNTYMNRLDSDEAKKIRRVTVEPYAVTRRNWLGRPTTKGMVITFERSGD